MIINLRNRFNFAKILLASTFLFSTLSSITKAGEEYAKALEAQANSKPILTQISIQYGRSTGDFKTTNENLTSDTDSISLGAQYKLSQRYNAGIAVFGLKSDSNGISFDDSTLNDGEAVGLSGDLNYKYDLATAFGVTLGYAESKNENQTTFGVPLVKTNITTETISYGVYASRVFGTKKKGMFYRFNPSFMLSDSRGKGSTIHSQSLSINNSLTSSFGKNRDYQGSFGIVTHFASFPSKKFNNTQSSTQHSDIYNSVFGSISKKISEDITLSISGSHSLGDDEHFENKSISFGLTRSY
jgi:hypothetical protein